MMNSPVGEQALTSGSAACALPAAARSVPRSRAARSAVREQGGVCLGIVVSSLPGLPPGLWPTAAPPPDPAAGGRSSPGLADQALAATDERLQHGRQDDDRGGREKLQGG